jgi:hypothetical protein
VTCTSGTWESSKRSFEVSQSLEEGGSLLRSMPSLIARGDSRQ